LEEETSRDDGEEIDSSSIVSLIKKLVRKHIQEGIQDLSSLSRFLKIWWCKYYSRPFKDPLLETYSLEELLYEYFYFIEEKQWQIEKEQLEGDKIEEDKRKDGLKWAEEMEKMEQLENDKIQQNKIENTNITDKDKQWMEEYIKKNKEQQGETFGEDIEEVFNKDG